MESNNILYYLDLFLHSWCCEWDDKEVGAEVRIKIQREKTDLFWFTDDTTILAENEGEVNVIVTEVGGATRKFPD